MKKLFMFMAIAMLVIACGKAEKVVTNATDIIPPLATEVLPAASPMVGLGKVATDVIPDAKEIIDATEIVPSNATEVLPVAAPVEGLGKVATDVVPNE